MSLLNKYKTLGLVFLVVIIVGFFAWRAIVKSKDFTPIEPTNVFKSIEYVEELRLTTYFFEELLILGTPDNLKQIRDGLQKEVADLHDEERKRSFAVDQAKSKLKNIEDQIFSSNPTLSKARQEEEDLHTLYKEINKSDRRLIKELEKKPDVFGEAVKKEFEQYQFVQEKIKSTSGAQKQQWKNNLSIVMQNLSRALKTERDLRWNTWQKKKAEADRLESQDDSNQKDLKKERRKAENALSDAEKELKKIQRKVANKEEELERAEAEYENLLQNKGDTIKPKLMIIAEAEISGYVNLKDLKINQRPFGDTLEVHVPRPQLDSVIVRIDDDSTHLYQLAKSSMEEVSEKGAYYDIFQQLKNEIIVAEGRVKQRALEAGIIAETHRLAKEYVEQFAGNLKLPVVFRDSIEAPLSLPKLPPPPILKRKDTLPSTILDSLPTLNAPAIKQRQESRKDSSLLEIE